MNDNPIFTDLSSILFFSLCTGEFILEYVGEIVTITEFNRRLKEDYSQEEHHYAMSIGSGMVIDGYRKSNIGVYSYVGLVVKATTRVCEVHVIQTYKPCAIGAIPMNVGILKLALGGK